jgi:hypothetical protein
MRGVIWIASVIAALAPAARASDAIGPHIDIRIEQPVYAGLPVWLDVDAHAACPDWHNWRGIVLGRTDGPDVVGPNGENAAFTPASHPLNDHAFAARSACPAYPSTTLAGTIRIPLHLAASIRTPGDYQVRWIVLSPDNSGVIASSHWLPFTVSPSTPAQREAWLEHVLKLQPRGKDAILSDYVPSLLAAYDDPRVIRRVMDLTCSSDELSGVQLGSGVAYTLDQDIRDYAVTLVRHGCTTRGLIGFLAQHGVPDNVLRTAFTETALWQISAGSFADRLHAMQVLEWANRISNDALTRRANTAILQFAPRIVANPDFSAKNILIDYAREHVELPDCHELLRRIAMRGDRSSEMAMDALVEIGDPGDLPNVAARLSGPLDGLDMNNVAATIRSLGGQNNRAPAFEAAALQALHTIMARAQVADIRDTAALAAAHMNDKAGISAVLRVLQDGTPHQTALVLDGKRQP